MASPSLTYTLTNGQANDADEVMTNFNDLLNGIVDGTKDLSINALTCAGTVTLNGTSPSITLNNGATDGGAVNFDGGTTSYLKSNAAGTQLDLGGFGLFKYTGAVATVEASGTSQGDVVLTTMFTYIDSVSNNNLVTLPEAATGLFVMYSNKSGSTVSVSPASGDAISTLAVDVAVSVPNSENGILFAVSDSLWMGVTSFN